MKKTLLIVVLTIILYSCSNEKQKHSPVNKLSTEDTKDTLYRSTANVVYKNVVFGINKKKYESLVPEYFNNIGNSRYMLDPVFNHNDSLVCLSFTSMDKTANYIDTDVTNDMENLMSVIKSKYGHPQVNFGEIKFFDFKPNHIQWKYGWKLYTKAILIGMIENKKGNTYSAVMWIYDKPSYEKHMNSTNDIEQSLQKTESNNF